MGGQEGIADRLGSHLAVAQDEMGQHGEDRLASRALHAPDGETAKPHAGIMGVAGQRATAVTGRLVCELEAKGEEKGQDTLDERLGIAKELRVGGLIVEIDSDRTILACRFGGLCHVSSPMGWRWMRMRHDEANVLKDQPYCGMLRTLPLNPGESGARWCDAELHRLQGELLLQQHAEHQAEAENCFHHALDIARNQQAKSFELRAATSLARLWQQQGKRQEAHDLLAPVYHWFTEGFDTADLQDAKALLHELEDGR
jgi:hypothetical protein